MLTPGTRLGPYEIVAAIGAGGMGEVYRARDARLGRDVAIKILPDAFASDLDRIARFQREAQVLGSLNHPNIAHIYGLEDLGVNKALVLELVDGPTLAELIAKGPIPLEDAVPVARQIADAFQGAHDQGIIHRDLKPANIKLTTDGTVKVLDFGLAKLSSPADSTGIVGHQADLTASPTITSPALATHGGIILGTAAYMSPEQAKGRPVDKRTDIWAFGCVLFEMLTGQRAFEGDDVSDTLAAILRGEPEWGALPADLPIGLGTLLKRCLEKDRRRRVGDMAAARFVLDEPALIAPAANTTNTAPASTKSRERVFWAALFLVAATTAGYLYLRSSGAGEPVRRLSIALPEGARVTHIAMSPDGRRLALALSGFGDRRGQLWVRSFDSPDLQPLSNTAGARTPFWSADSRSIGFFADGKLRTISASGGPPRDLCDGTGLGAGGTWNRSGEILFGGNVGARSLRRVNETGGACTDVTKPEGMLHAYPWFLPDGEHFLYFVGGAGNQRGVYVASLTDPSGRRVLADVSSAMFSPSSFRRGPGHLLFLREGTLMAQPFDEATLETHGDVVPVATRASFSFSAPQVAASVSDDGSLVYLANRPVESQLRWVDRTGTELATAGPKNVQQGVVLSPNDESVAFSRERNGWRRDLVRDVETSFGERFAGDGAWSSDGRRLISGFEGKLVLRDIGAGKEDELQVEGRNSKFVSDWSRDERFLIYTEVDAKTQADIWVLEDPLNRTSSKKPTPFMVTPFTESQARLSPDGRWVAYISNESGQSAVYVTSFPAASTKQRISPNDGREPRWRADGRELYFLAGAGGRFKVTAVPVEARAGGLHVGAPTGLFDIRTVLFVPHSNIFQYSPASNGQRFLVNVLVSDAEPTLNVITNWQAAARAAK